MEILHVEPWAQSTYAQGHRFIGKKGLTLKSKSPWVVAQGLLMVFCAWRFPMLEAGKLF